MKNLIVIAILLVIIGFAIWYIIKSKKKGIKCIGCPSGCSCANKVDKEDCGGCIK